MLADLSLVVDLGGVAGTGRTVELHARAHELRGVLVGRGEVDVEPGRRTLRGDGAHHVVGLEVVNPHHRNAERVGDLERVGDGRGEVLGHLLALRLVGRVGAMAEGRTAGVHRQRQPFRALALDDRHEPVDEPEQRGGVDPRRGHARRLEKHEMPPVEERHQIDYEELFHNTSVLPGQTAEDDAGAGR